MPKKISVKTVDGNRYDYVMPNEVDYNLLSSWLCFIDGPVRRFYYVPNIVSITETEIEDAEKT